MADVKKLIKNEMAELLGKAKENGVEVAVMDEQPAEPTAEPAVTTEEVVATATEPTAEPVATTAEPAEEVVEHTEEVKPSLPPTSKGAENEESIIIKNDDEVLSKSDIDVSSEAEEEEPTEEDAESAEEPEEPVEEPEEPAPVSEDEEPEKEVDIYNNVELTLLLKKLGIFNAIEKIAKGEVDSNVLKAASALQKVTTEYSDGQAYVATYLESKGVNIEEYCDSSYSEVQMLFIGEQVRNKTANIEVILNSGYSVQQMELLLNLKNERGIDVSLFRPDISITVMKELAECIQLGYDVSDIFTIAHNLSWHGCELIRFAVKLGCDYKSFITTPDGATPADAILDENGIYRYLVEEAKKLDTSKAVLNEDGLSYEIK